METLALKRRPILVCGAHRTGTTWVGKMLAAGGETAYISEPLNILHRPGVLRVPVRNWYTYICADNQAEYLPALQETLALRYHPGSELAALRSLKDAGRMARDWSIFTQGRLRRRRPLLKDPFAVFSAAWFADCLHCEVVITVRHPAAFASSLKRLGWPFDFSHLLRQPLLLRDWLNPLREQMAAMTAAPDDIIGQAALLWRAVYAVVAQLREDYPQLQVVRHEDLSLAPLDGFQALYAALGLEFNSAAEQVIRNSSASDNPAELSRRAAHSVRLDSRANLHNWKHRLAAEEINRVRVLTESVAAHFYQEITWE